MGRAVMIERLGSLDGLVVEEVPRPDPGPGEVRVRVRAAGLNPVDVKIVEVQQSWEFYRDGQSLPLGNGSDLSGVVEAIGEGEDEWQPGDEVFGDSRFHAEADFAIVGADALLRKPGGLPWEQAGALAIVGRTAVASVRAVALQPGETVLVSAAAGGVGALAAQLALRTGARVIGTASPENHDFLRSLGVVPVAYGDGLVDAVRELAPDGVDAVLDNHGRETLEAAVALGVDPARVNTIADRAYAAEIGALGVGGAAASQSDLADLADLIATGEVRLEIDSVFPLERVHEAYARLKGGHLRGKIVLVTE